MVQILQNKAARYVTKLLKHTKVNILLDKCKWLSVSQLIVYHSIISLKNQMLHKRSRQLMRRISTINSRGRNFMRDNRLYTRKGRILMTNLSWRNRCVDIWNILPNQLRVEKRISVFKKGLKDWIKEWIPVVPTTNGNVHLHNM